MADKLGYFAVIVQDRDFFQAFYLLSGYEKLSDELINNVRKQFSEQTPSVVENPSIGVSEEDQPYVGAVSAVLVEFVLKGQPYGVIVASAALAKLFRQKYFYIIANANEFVTSTKVYSMPHIEIMGMFPECDPFELARKYIGNLPEVKEIMNRMAKNKETRH